MALNDIDITAPITPGKSLGGLELRTPLLEMQQLIDGFGEYRLETFKLASPYEARYRFGSGEVTVCVDVRNGKVFKLIAGEGYIGKLYNTVSVGMTAGDAFAALPRLYFHAGEDIILLSQVDQGHTPLPGIAFNVAEDGPSLDLLPSLPIVAISVNIEELSMEAVQRALW
jgi:hypothetical protein